MENATGYSSTSYISLKPGYVKSIVNAAKQFKVYWKNLLWVFLLGTIVSFMLEIPTYLSLFSFNGNTIVPETGATQYPDNFGWLLLYMFIVMIIGCVLVYGYAYAALRTARGQKPSLIDFIIAV